MKILLTPEEIEFNKYYSFGTNTVMRLIERTGKEVASYPNKFSRIYKFSVIELYSVHCFEKEFFLNPKFQCFSEIDITEIKEMIQEKKEEIKILSNILK